MYLISLINGLLDQYKEVGNSADLDALGEHVIRINLHLENGEEYRRKGDYEGYARSLREALGYIEEIRLVCTPKASNPPKNDSKEKEDPQADQDRTEKQDKEVKLKVGTLIEHGQSPHTYKENQLGHLGYDMSENAGSILTLIGTLIVEHCNNLRFFNYPINSPDTFIFPQITNDAVTQWQDSYLLQEGDLQTNALEALVDFARNVSIQGELCNMDDGDIEQNINARLKLLLDKTTYTAEEKDCFISWLKLHGGQKNGMLAAWLIGNHHFTLPDNYQGRPTLNARTQDPFLLNWEIDKNSGKICFSSHLDFYQLSPGTKGQEVEWIMMDTDGQIKSINSENPKYDKIVELLHHGKKEQLGPVLSIASKIELNIIPNLSYKSDETPEETEEFILIANPNKPKEGPFIIIPTLVELYGLMFSPLLTAPASLAERDEKAILDLLTRSQMGYSQFANIYSPSWATSRLFTPSKPAPTSDKQTTSVAKPSRGFTG